MDRATPTLALSLLATSFVLMLFIAAPAVAEQGPLPKHRGYAEFQQYCASCHGVKANGTGPMAPVLNPPPADLTRLAPRYGSPLPRPRLIAIIDGRERIRGHGTSEMPVWGKRLHEANRGDQHRASQVRGTILVIIEYLEALQVE